VLSSDQELESKREREGEQYEPGERDRMRQLRGIPG